ncbi:hypothetical protein M409DRAFT_60386 [Zasmidium cellare ATCC 36951]|uniref:AB hydrolase-1 domain-containing protein n=1 Tax=Zasmidium cellare ATCC 36951 TaxID=1080233 RepID=A0A6A6BZ47_ZASCE|nr:uncharacterized protein M409DRAFT_60386 [Zasmidium cellare ATCC 36951]KAF2159985.1 hypothetical protein M409DRAFT_60386 [Zasmidium cellare ATCC 36951]
MAATLAPLSNQSTLLSGQRIAYGKHGQGTPVILVHGTPTASLIWRNVVPSLVHAGFEVYTFDLLGYGLSERPRDPSVDTSITAQVSVLEGLLKNWELEQKKFHIRFAILSPGRANIVSIAMIDCVSFDSYPSALTLQMMQRGFESLLRASDQDHRAHFREWLLSAVHNKAEFEQGALGAYIDYISGPIGQPSLVQHQIKHYDPKHTLEVSERYHELAQFPIKLIWGEHDAWQKLPWAYRLQSAIPGASLDVVPEAGHFSIEDRPEEINTILKTHFQSLELRS